MTIHFLPDPRPAPLLSDAFQRLFTLARRILALVRTRRTDRHKAIEEAAAKQARLQEKQRIFFTALAANIRTTTGNAGRPKPR